MDELALDGTNTHTDRIGWGKSHRVVHDLHRGVNAVPDALDSFRRSNDTRDRSV